MMMTGIRRLTAGMLLATALGNVSLAAQSPGEPLYADVIFTGGKVVTVDSEERIVDSVAIRKNRIVAVGETGPWKGPATKIVDLQGRTMLPGFIDAHSHVAGMANVEAHYVNVQVPPLADTKAIIAKLREAAAKKPAGAWIIGQGTYNQVFPTREELDAAFPDNPVRLDWSAHDRLINHRAAVVLGMGRDFPDPPKGSTGRYERTADGEVAIVRDAPAPWPKDEFTYPEMKEAVRGVLNDFYLEKGVTTVSDLSPGETYRAYAELLDEGRLPTRIRMNYIARDAASARKLLDTGLFTGFGNDWMRVGGLKLFIDGVWGTTAATYKPAWKGSGTTWVPENYGGTSMDQAALDAIILSAREHGWQVLTHANGDRAQDMVISAFEKANKIAANPDSRDRIEHFAHFLTQDPERTEARLQRMAENRIIPSPQVAFLWRLTDTNVKEPAVKFFPLRDLIDRGMHPPGGVDTIGTQNFATSPLFSIERAVRRDTKFGTIVQPKQAITVMEGIKMFTIWAAEANYLEKSLGSIEVGKLADFVVLEKDPLAAAPAEIDEIPVAMTIIDGKIVYERK